MKKTFVLVVVLILASIPVSAQEFAQQKLSDNVLVITAKFPWWEVNISAVKTDEGVVVIDTLYHPDAATSAEGIIKQFSDKPVKYVINTHFHPDHTFGNGVFENTTIIGHMDCAETLVTNIPGFVKGYKGAIQAMESQLPALEEKSPEQAGILKKRLDWSKMMVALVEEEGFTPTPPNFAIEKGATLKVGGKTFKILNWGPYHTNTDLIVHVPEERLVALGDLYHRNNLPYVNTTLIGDPQKLIAVYDKLIALGCEVDHYVPGHGPVATVDFLKEHRSYLQDLVNAVKDAKEGGLALEQAKAEITLEKYKHFGNFQRIHAANIENCWNALEKSEDDKK